MRKIPAISQGTGEKDEFYVEIFWDKRGKGVDYVESTLDYVEILKVLKTDHKALVYRTTVKRKALQSRSHLWHMLDSFF